MDLIDFGKRCGHQVPRVNIGAMRLPKDVDEAVELIRYAIDSGMRYIDTSRGYTDSEIKLGKALKDGYREKVILSTKWSPWNQKLSEPDTDDDASASCTRKRLDESMKRLDVEYLDFYQVWSVTKREEWDAVTTKGGMVDGIRKAMDEGLVKHTGFTTHDSVENLVSYVEEADWCEIILFSYNLLNRNIAPAIRAAHEKGIGTVLMNPVGGGRLGEPSEVLMKLAREVGASSVPDLAMRYLHSEPAVDTIIVGINRKRDVDDAVRAAESPVFTPEQMERIDTFLDGLAREEVGFCTRCKYCMPCPQGIDIPRVMSSIYNERYWGLKDAARKGYSRMKGPKADACTECRECEEKCTQKLKISEEMAYAARSYA